jgi:cyclic pyranopterin phosphate synthase
VRDGFGREIDYLRLSLTERCNLRCAYCMPEDLRFEGAEDVLAPSELATVVRAAVSLGFRKFRLTGGEPTVRADLLDVVRAIAAVPGAADLSLTTNGMRLAALAAPLRAAGLRRVNVHLDSLDAETLPDLMRRARVERILEGVAAAEAAGLAPIKLNVVVQRGGNDAAVASLARLALERPWHVRFIELMPLGAGACGRVARERFVPSAETRARIEAEVGPLRPLPRSHVAEEARNYHFAAGPGVVGFISPVSEPYCGTCNRLRLTADGRLRLCLLRDDERDVRAALRDGEAAVRAVLARAVSGKPAGHALEAGETSRARLMHAIGG